MADFWDVTEADYDAVLDVNLKGAFFLTQAFVRKLRDAKRPGRVINISSMAAQKGASDMAHYAASKGGVRLYTKSLALEVAREGIRVNSVHPGVIWTDMQQVAIQDNPD